MEHETRQTIALCNSVIMVADKFINKVKEGRARSTETLADLTKLKIEAQTLKGIIVEKHENI